MLDGGTVGDLVVI